MEKYRAITKTYFKGAHGIVLVYDINNEESFKSIDGWMEEIENHAPSTVSIVLCGNKCDLEGLRQVTTEEGKEIAKTYGIQFNETSARNNINLEETFTNLTKDIKNRFDKAGVKGNAHASFKLSDQESNQHRKKKKRCC